MQRICDKEAKPREFHTKLLTNVLPRVGKEVFDIYASYMAHSKYQNQRKQAIHRCFLRDKLEFKRKSEKLMLEHLSEKLQKVSRMRQAEEQSAIVKRLRSDLEDKRKTHTRLQQEMDRKLQLKDEQAKRELEMLKAKFEKHAQFVRQQADSYKLARLSQIKKQLAEKQRLDAEYKRLVQEEVEKKALEVYKRQAIAEYGLIQKLEDKKWRQSEEEARRERINQAIENYKDRPIVERDERRMMSDTEALNLRKEAKEEKPLFNNPGFYDEKLMNDPRFKLQTRLFEAGLQNNAYARQLFNTLSKPAD